MTRIGCIAGAVALLLTPAAGAAASAPPASAAQSAPSPWLALSMLTTSGIVGLGDAAAQPGPGPESPPPSEPYAAGGIPTPVIAFWVITVAAMVYIATRHDSGHIHIRVSNSPS